ncbi:MAG: inorganic phosphate transporter [Veillonellaceae bacterium]|nr:inorganic phosphate transporter [Veillonellaceae bacterium]
MHEQWILWGVIFFAVLFDYINGFHDTANAVATSVSTRAIQPRHAIAMAAILNFVGAMVSTGVAKTIGGGIVLSPIYVNSQVLIAALVGANAWNLLSWYFGMPSSSSHALVGGLIGAVTISTGSYALDWTGIGHIFLALVLSPLVALTGGYFVMVSLLWIFGKRAPIDLNRKFRRLQLVSAAMMAFSHGSNDAQKSMGIITLALLAAGEIAVFEVPFWAKLTCATAMGLGTAVGGWRIITTVGRKVFRMESINGFAADLNSALVISTATFLHMPVSTTHVVSGSIMGVGSAKRITAVNWAVARNMVLTWVSTIPLSGAVSALVFWLMKASGL